MGLFNFRHKGRPAKANSARKSAAGQRVPKANQADIQLELGPCEVAVQGVEWCKIPLSNNQDRILSLTPRNRYQQEHGWPEVGAVNVNKNGSKRTTEKNWVGYIPAHQAVKLNALVMTHGITRVHARVLNGTVTLLLPRSYT